MSLARDTALIFKRSITLQLRVPVWVIIGVTQPILYLALFGPLLQNTIVAPGAPQSSAWLIFVPGLLVQLALFGAGNAGFGIVFEYLEGVIERMRVTPASRLALLLGRVATSIVMLMVQSVILLAIAVPFGFRPDWAGVVLLLVLIAILGSALAATSNALGLTLKDVGALASVVNGVMVPLLLLSGILIPMSFAPTWLQNLSKINPLTYIVNASRDLVVGQYTTSATITGFCVAIALAIIAFWWGSRTFKTQNA